MNPIHSKLIHTVLLGDETVKGRDQDRLLDMYVFLSDPDKMLRSNMESLVDLYVSHMMWSMDELLN